MSSAPVQFVRRLALFAATAPLLVACTSPLSHDDGGADAACPATIVLRGSTYWGHGQLKRDPATTGRHVAAVIPGCDDSGGQDPADPAEPVRVGELAEVPLETAFLWKGSIFVRDGRELPTKSSTWFRAPRCTTATEFRLIADWLAVTASKQPRFDGDLRPPYRLEVQVTRAPARYLGATIGVHADASTEPTLGPEDVAASLWRGGTVIARVRCDGGRFQALSLRVPPHP